MSLPAMLVGETVGEILQATQFARDLVAAVSNKTHKISPEDPKTPETEQKKQRPNPENTELRSRRRREKQNKLQSIRYESNNSPSLQRARSRINFKVVSPLKVKDLEKENTKFLAANRVSPRNKPWTKKTVLFPNPLFQPSQSSQQQRFCKTRSPVIPRNKGTPHKFLIKSPAKVQVKIKSPPAVVNSPKVSRASKLRRSFSPSRLANRLMSPLKSRRMSLDKGAGSTSGLKQRPQAMPMRFSIGRMQGL